MDVDRLLDQLVLRDETRVFRATVTAACIDANGKPVRLPAEIRALAQRLREMPPAVSCPWR